jgi:hypothetical protein
MITPAGKTRSSPAPQGAIETLTQKARLPILGNAAPSTLLWLFCAACYCLALALSVTGSSLWTDEAFSAWEASHRTFGSLIHSLRAGDSSDLQVGGYYIWLFGWVRLFGASELALRSANLPFALIFSLIIVWGSFRLLGSRWAWLPIGMLPFIWQFASEVRAYMASLAFSTASLVLLLAFLQSRCMREARRFAWMLLGAALCGCIFHMLFLLCIPPLLTVAILISRASGETHWRAARLPAAVLAAPFALYFVFLAWTFTRANILYDYPKPGLRQMASVAYEMSGFAGFGPNRKFSLDFAAHSVPLAFGGAVLFAGFLLAMLAAQRNRSKPFVRPLAIAVVVGCVETIVLAILTNKQPDARHLAALVPVFLFLLMSAITHAGRAGTLAAVFLGVAWMSADVRVAIVPEYRKEDFRQAVASAIAIHNQTGADIAVASDPAGAAYYGLDVHGDSPCYPYVTDCSSALNEVHLIGGKWARTVPAQYVARWDFARASAWLAGRDRPVIVIAQKDRSRRDWPWRRIIDRYPGAPRQPVHGFDVVLLRQ